MSSNSANSLDTSDENNGPKSDFTVVSSGGTRNSAASSAPPLESLVHAFYTQLHTMSISDAARTEEALDTIDAALQGYQVSVLPPSLLI